MKELEQLRENIDDCAISLYFNLQEKSEPVYCVTYRDDTIIVHVEGELKYGIPKEWKGWKVLIRDMT